jgi:hypothetical protein
MLRTIFVSTLAAFVFALNVPAANAQTICGQRAKFLEHLAKNHNEAPTSIGITNSGQVLEVLSSKDGGWTIILTHPNGVTCLMASGEAWEPVERGAMAPAA